MLPSHRCRTVQLKRERTVAEVALTLNLHGSRVRKQVLFQFGDQSRAITIVAAFWMAQSSTSHPFLPLLLAPPSPLAHRLALLQQSPVYLFEVRRLFFSVSITMLVLIPSTRAVSRMPLPFIAISLICCFTSFNRPRSLNCKRKDFLEQAAFRQQYRCLPAALRPCLTTSTLWQSGQQIGSTTILPFPIFRDLYIRLHSCTNPHVHNTTAHS